MIDSRAFENTNQPPRICPACHQRTLVELVFGMPGPELFEASEQGDLVLGGCCISPTLACDSPDLTCTTCNWTGFELYGQIFEENDLVGVMNAHAQRASELFLQGTGLGYFVGDNAGYEMPAGWAEMLSTMAGAFGEVVEHAATVRQVADAAEDFPTEFGHSLDGHAELRFQAERSLESMRQRLVGLALAVIGAHADVGDATTVEMADRAAAGVLDRYRDDAAAAIETIYAETSAAVRVELRQGLRSCHDARLGHDPHQQQRRARPLWLAKRPTRRMGTSAVARRTRTHPNMDRPSPGNRSRQRDSATA